MTPSAPLVRTSATRDRCLVADLDQLDPYAVARTLLHVSDGVTAWALDDARALRLPRVVSVLEKISEEERNGH